MAMIYSASLRALLALLTIFAGACVFRSEAQYWLEHRHENTLAPPPPPVITAHLLDQKRVHRYAEQMIYFDPAIAEATLLKVLASAPLDANAWSRLSLAQFYSGHFQLANASAQHALSMAPENAHVAYEQAILAADFWEQGTATTHAEWLRNIDNLVSKNALGLAQYSRETQRARRLCSIAPAESSLEALCRTRRRQPQRNSLD